MKCPHCGSLNKDDAKFCKNCGNPINNSSLAYQDKFGKNQSVKEEGSSKSKNILIVCITVIICVAIVAGALIYMNSNSDDDAVVNDTVNTTNQSINVTPKSWKLVDSYMGSGTGVETYDIPEGKIKVKIFAYPKKNYEDNYLDVSSSTGDSIYVEWGSDSPVKTKSDEMTFTSSGGDSIRVDYYETVDWKVEIYKYS